LATAVLPRPLWTETVLLAQGDTGTGRRLSRCNPGTAHGPAC